MVTSTGAHVTSWSQLLSAAPQTRRAGIARACHARGRGRSAVARAWSCGQPCCQPCVRTPRLDAPDCSARCKGHYPVVYGTRILPNHMLYGATRRGPAAARPLGATAVPETTVLAETLSTNPSTRDPMDFAAPFCRAPLWPPSMAASNRLRRTMIGHPPLYLDRPAARDASPFLFFLAGWSSSDSDTAYSSRRAFPLDGLSSYS